MYFLKLAIFTNKICFKKSFFATFTSVGQTKLPVLKAVFYKFEKSDFYACMIRHGNTVKTT